MANNEFLFLAKRPLATTELSCHRHRRLYIIVTFLSRIGERMSVHVFYRLINKIIRASSFPPFLFLTAILFSIPTFPSFIQTFNPHRPGHPTYVRVKQQIYSLTCKSTTILIQSMDVFVRVIVYKCLVNCRCAT